MGTYNNILMITGFVWSVTPFKCYSNWKPNVEYLT